MVHYQHWPVQGPFSVHVFIPFYGHSSLDIHSDMFYVYLIAFMCSYMMCIVVCY